MSSPPQDEEGFLTRWSRRKRESHLATEDIEEALPVPTGAAEEPEGGLPEDRRGVSEDPELASNREAAEAVDLESLTYESDFKVFMKRGVPDALKNAALRKLWRSNPDLAVLDGLNDYDTDFRTAETALGQLQSAWKVGRGYADKAEEVAAEMEARSARAAEGGPAVEGEGYEEARLDAGPGEDASTEVEDVEDTQAMTETADRESGTATDGTVPVAKAPRRRRMAFDVGN